MPYLIVLPFAQQSTEILLQVMPCRGTGKHVRRILPAESNPYLLLHYYYCNAARTLSPARIISKTMHCLPYEVFP